jgi:hypothetical protein
MSFLADVRRELDRVGIRGGLARRIEAELADHLACDPQAQLGTPPEIAERFAAELRVARTRRSSLAAFGALLLCAALTMVAGSRPGHAGPFAGLAIVALAQVAFVAGLLGLLGLRARTVGRLRLAQRRALIALLAAAGVCVAATAVTWLALVPLAAVAFALARTRSAWVLTPAGERPAPELPPAALVALGAIAVGGILAQGIVGEHSLSEGLIRAGMEAGGLAAAVAVLGRPLGLRT